MIDQEKLDREYVEGLEKTIDNLGKELGRYRDENLELENRLEQADREIDHLRTAGVRMEGAIRDSIAGLARSLWTPRRHGAEAE